MTLPDNSLIEKTFDLSFSSPCKSAITSTDYLPDIEAEIGERTVTERLPYFSSESEVLYPETCALAYSLLEKSSFATLVFDKDDMKITIGTKNPNLLGTHKLTIVAHYKNMVPLKSIVTQQNFNVIFIEPSTLPLDQIADFEKSPFDPKANLLKA